MDGEPRAWVESVCLADGEEYQRVIFAQRMPGSLVVRLADPCDPPSPRVPIYEGEELVVMTALSHVSFHSSDDPANSPSDYQHSARIVPVRTEGNVVFARTLRFGEDDDGRRVHVPPGASVTFEQGAIQAHLDDIDSREHADATGYVPLAPVLLTWFGFGREHHDDNGVRYLVAAARRLDMAAEMLRRRGELEVELGEGELPGPQLRRLGSQLVGSVELSVISLAKAVRMIVGAGTIGIRGDVPESLRDASPVLDAIRHAYEHIEERALGMTYGKEDAIALSIFDHRSLLVEDTVKYGDHALNLTQQVPALIDDARATLKEMAGDALPPGTVFRRGK